MNLEENSTTTDYFFDTYAFLEILKGNESYKEYKDLGIVTTKLNMFELYLKVLREDSLESSDAILKKYYPFVKDFDEEIIREATKLKIQLNKRDVSMTDCIGYCFAKQLGIKFLTGDNAFKGMENVEFVK